jgi:hypothetical protein
LIELAGVAEAAAILGVSKARVGQLRAAGRLPRALGATRSGPVWLRSDLEAHRAGQVATFLSPVVAAAEFTVVGLTEEQQRVHRALRAEQADVASLYEIGCRLLASPWIPDHLALAAHEFREAIDQLIEMARAPGLEKPKELSAAMKDLRSLWPTSVAKGEDGMWPADAIQIFAPFLDKFQDLMAASGRTEGQVRAYIGWRDPLGTQDATNHARHRAWNANWSFFKNTCHHRGATIEEFEQRLSEFNRLVLGVLGPQVVGEYDAIDAILQEADHAGQS